MKGAWDEVRSKIQNIDKLMIKVAEAAVEELLRISEEVKNRRANDLLERTGSTNFRALKARNQGLRRWRNEKFIFGC